MIRAFSPLNSCPSDGFGRDGFGRGLLVRRLVLQWIRPSCTWVKTFHGSVCVNRSTPLVSCRAAFFKSSYCEQCTETGVTYVVSVW